MDRLSRLERHPLPGGGRLLVARTFGQRLKGLAGLHSMPAGHALLLPRCSSVHTAGMRFAIDVAFLDPAGDVLALVEGVGPWRIVRHRGADAVVETAAGAARGLGFAPRS
jgi:uncharacterized membrane protein (UPF0127 family)